MMSGSSASWKSAGAVTGTGSVPDKFPAGLRVLVVDDDPVCLTIIEKLLKKCNYEAITCNRAEIGLSMLRENKNVCDVVLSDVHMPDMDGFKLLEQIGLEMDLPVIMMSADESSDVVMKGVTHGACDYIIKPVRIEALRNIWQHVVRRHKQKWKDSEAITSANDVDYTSSGNEGHNWKNAKRRKDEDDDSEERDESSKKPRVVWTVELHQQFVAAVNQLGPDKSVPKKILELMNVPGITRENIASHLQKYRLYLKRLSESHQMGSGNNSFMGILDPSYDLRALGVGSQLPSQSLATVLGRSYNSRSLFPTPAIDQRNTFIFEDPRWNQGRLLHGISTNMEPKPFMNLHQPRHHSFNGVNNQVLLPMSSQGQSQNQSQSESQHVVPNAMLANGLGSNVSGGGFVPSYNMLNDSNQIRRDPGPQNMTFSDLLTYTSPRKMGPTTSFADQSGTHRDGIGDDQDDLLTAFLNKQPQEVFGQPEDEFDFDGYALDDLPRTTN